MRKPRTSVSVVIAFLAALFIPATGNSQVKISPLEVVKRHVVAREDANGMITLPIRFHIAKTAKWLTYDAEVLDCWLVPNDVVSQILPEINRVWAPANIRWELEAFIVHTVAPGPILTTNNVVINALSPAYPFLTELRSEAEFILKTKRDANGRSDFRRIPKIYRFFDERSKHPTIQNVYFFPYIGATSQGNAGHPANWRNGVKVGRSDPGYIPSNQLVVGIWSDKPSNGRRAPQKRKLVESGPFYEGSLGLTCAHELGHHLGLGHPNQPDVKSLMDSNQYQLTIDEINTARRHARARINP